MGGWVRSAELCQSYIDCNWLGESDLYQQSNCVQRRSDSGAANQGKISIIKSLSSFEHPVVNKAHDKGPRLALCSGCVRYFVMMVEYSRGQKQVN